MSTQAGSKQLTLEYVKTIGLATNQTGRGFVNPYDVAVGKDGRIFVLNHCDSARKNLIRIGIINMDEDYLGEFGKGAGLNDDQFNSPVSMAFDSQERLYITDELNHRVTIFDSSGNFLDKWDTKGSGPGEFNGPAGIAIDSNDNIYIVDQHNSRVQKLSNDGKSIAEWGEFGSGPGQFNLPWGIAVDADANVYVADWRNDRIQKFSTDGLYLASFGKSGEGDGELSRPAGVAVDPDGFVYVADWGNERIQVFAADGSFVLKERGQATLSRWAHDYLNVNLEEKAAREISNLVPELPAHLDTPQHVSAQTEPYFWGPVSVRLDGDGRVYIPESNRHRVQIYQRK